MKNVSSLKSDNTQSPKTPGGISKSLLTPCRRLGLSRNWKKNGPSPFRSPLAGNEEVKEEKIETRKRKEPLEDANITVKEVNEVSDTNANINKTPSRNVDLPRRKKSKTLLSTINKSQEDISTNVNETCQENTVQEPKKVDCRESDSENVSVPVRSKSKKSKKVSPKKKSDVGGNVDINKQIKENITTEQSEKVVAATEKCPNDLTKECIVVIQKKVFKNLIKPENNVTNTEMSNNKEDSTSHTFLDSDSDEVPLIHLNKIQPAHEDDDFTVKTNNIKPRKDISPKNKQKRPKHDNIKVVKAIIEPKPSQTAFDDDDDFDDKKTIIIRKTYDKVIKPQKAKSTGSITQKDIDELRARIEAKKKLLLAKSLTPETAELRSLIKKWQKGCQDALAELLELMRGKFPEQNMDYSEMLKALKIPASLVGYDSENDSFNTPNDEDIILGQLNNM